MTLKLICALHKALLVHRHGHFPTHTTPLHLGRLLLLAHLQLHLRLGGHPSLHPWPHPTHLLWPVHTHTGSHHTWLHRLHVRVLTYGLRLYAADDWLLGHHGASGITDVGHLVGETGHVRRAGAWAVGMWAHEALPALRVDLEGIIDGGGAGLGVHESEAGIRGLVVLKHAEVMRLVLAGLSCLGEEGLVAYHGAYEVGGVLHGEIREGCTPTRERRRVVAYTAKERRGGEEGAERMSRDGCAAGWAMLGGRTSRTSRGAGTTGSGGRETC